MITTLSAGILLAFAASAVPPAPASSPTVSLGADCNGNGIPDDQDIANGTSQDCNGDGIPDDCITCPVEVVFIMDTSASMDDEGGELCMASTMVLDQLAQQGVAVNFAFYGINQTPNDYPCLEDTVRRLYGETTPGDTGDCPPIIRGGHPHNESWGLATAIVAQEYGWIPGALRIIVPMGDEGPCRGNRTVDNDGVMNCNGTGGGADRCLEVGCQRDSILNAIDIANQNGVTVSPIVGDEDEAPYGSPADRACVENLAQLLADGTGGVSTTTETVAELTEAILALVKDACDNQVDCNGNGLLDECETRDLEPGCSGLGERIPELEVEGCLEAGSSFTLLVSRGRPLAHGCILIGDAQVDRDIGCCKLLVGGTMLGVIEHDLDAAGEAALEIPVPSGFSGEAFFQAGYCDEAACGDFSFSRGLAVTILP